MGQIKMYKPLFNAQVCIDGGIARCASQVLVFSVGDVLSCSVVSVLLRQTKVNKEQLSERERTHAGYPPITQSNDNTKVNQKKIQKITYFLHFKNTEN